MKRFVSLLATLCLMQGAHSQTTAVPGFISYQGRALNSAGTVMGSGTPVNRLVTFRIWDHASSSLPANLVYSEQQVVTIAEEDPSSESEESESAAASLKSSLVSDSVLLDSGSYNSSRMVVDCRTSDSESSALRRSHTGSSLVSLEAESSLSVGGGSFGGQ